MTTVVGFPSVEDYNRNAQAVRQVLRGGIEHPFHRRQAPVDGFEILRGKPDSDITKGTSGTVSRWDSTSDTGINDTVYFIVADGVSGKWVYYCDVGGQLEAISGEC